LRLDAKMNNKGKRGLCLRVSSQKGMGYPIRDGALPEGMMLDALPARRGLCMVYKFWCKKLRRVSEAEAVFV
jgi:hypothetical protein